MPFLCRKVTLQSNSKRIENYLATLHSSYVDLLNQPSCLLSVNEVAKALGVSGRTIRRLIYNDKIPYFKIGTVYRFQLEEVLSALRSRRKGSSDASKSLSQGISRRESFSTDKVFDGPRKSVSMQKKDIESLFRLLLAKQKKNEE